MTKEFKSGFVSIIGRPNVGKSTLLNNMIGEKIAIMSNKPQTTRNKVLAILSTEEYQIVFMDTPGIHKPKNKLGEFMVKAARDTLNEVDTILFVVEADKNIGQGELKIIEELKGTNTPVILVINKVDLVKKDMILPLIEEYGKVFDFHSMIPISALNNDGTTMILDDIKKILPEGPQYFPEDMITDQPERQIVAEIIREKVLQLLQKEVPHGVAVEVLSMKDNQNKDIIEITANIYCEKDSHKGIIIGNKGVTLKRIGSLARADIEKFLGSKVFLEVWVKVKKDWRNKDFFIKNFGYQ
ncbi:GTPase Era [Petroclostridium sp. X23]|uniref:GTPase Era n=1 Tax=Petroclostridium sp. X23 TaxID=3045146 RepID=UPI0024AE741C|nr:GTPase Era [Petroclostridium sp. X23]WHH59574.1 GTPase Era [Petroclostridium sp. X23]